MSEEKRNTTYTADSEVAQAAQTLLHEKEAREDKTLPRGRTKRFLVDERLISNVPIKNLSVEENRIYYYVCSIVNENRTAAEPCSTNRSAEYMRTRRRDTNDMKKVVDAPGGDDGGWC